MSKNKLSQEELQELKDSLEDSARGLNVDREQATLKSPEQKQADKEWEQWKETKHKVAPIREFSVPHDLIKCLLSTNQFNGLVFLGEGGIGKSVLTIASIKNALKPNGWEYSNGYTTPLALYDFLYQNRDKKVIILDDVEGVFNNKLSLSILKGALWDSDGKRIVQYSSKSDKADMPQKFIMKAKVIILCNHIPRQDDASTRAMLSRTIPYEIKFTFKQKMKICKTFIERDTNLTAKDRQKVNTMLEKNVSEATKDFNFRTLRKLISFVQYDHTKAERLFQATTQVDELREAYIKATETTQVVKAQIALFAELTGMSRRTFFRVKRQMVS